MNWMSRHLPNTIPSVGQKDIAKRIAAAGMTHIINVQVCDFHALLPHGRSSIRWLV